VPKTRIVVTPSGLNPVAARPGRPGNPNWVPGHHEPGGVPFTPESRAAMPEPPNQPGAQFSALARSATDEGAELIAFMLAVMRGDVVRFLPPALTDEQVARIAEAYRLVATHGCGRAATGGPGSGAR
jgi:hypothetical protein